MQSCPSGAAVGSGHIVVFATAANSEKRAQRNEQRGHRKYGRASSWLGGGHRWRCDDGKGTSHCNNKIARCILTAQVKLVARRRIDQFRMCKIGSTKWHTRDQWGTQPKLRGVVRQSSR